MIELQNITVRRGGDVVLSDVSATAKSGRCVALVGPNGSGKSTLLKALAGVLPYEGRTNLPKAPRARAKALAYLAQDVSAPPMRLIRDIVALGRTPHIGALSRLREEDQAAINSALETCRLAELSERRFGTLSGGEQTRVHLARTLATEAPLLLADEPVTALDPYYQISVMQTLRTVANEGRIVITALHDLDLARRFCDQIWVLHEGKLVAQGAPEDALKNDILNRVFRITPEGQIVE